MFTFKKFTIRQDRCAMKVGTDGVLIGAWAGRGINELHDIKNILDIGTGTGLIALMSAQRFPGAMVTAIDIDKDATEQAKENVQNSPFTHNIKVLHQSLQEYIEDEDVLGKYDIVVCNPPFFDNSLTCPDPKRNTARHNSTLPFASLVKGARRLMADNGLFAIVIPSECRQKIEDEAIFTGLMLSRRVAVVTKEGKRPKRYLLEFTLKSTTIDEHILSLESEEYRALTADFYLTKAEKS